MSEGTNWLTLEQIDDVIANVSADDIIEAVATYPELNDHVLEGSRLIFNRAAERMGMSNGATAAQMIPAHMFTTWTERMGDLMRLDSPDPKSPRTEDLRSSADTGE